MSCRVGRASGEPGASLGRAWGGPAGDLAWNQIEITSARALLSLPAAPGQDGEVASGLRRPACQPTGHSLGIAVHCRACGGRSGRAPGALAATPSRKAMIGRVLVPQGLLCPTAGAGGGALRRSLDGQGRRRVAAQRCVPPAPPSRATT